MSPRLIALIVTAALGVIVVGCFSSYNSRPVGKTVPAKDSGSLFIEAEKERDIPFKFVFAEPPEVRLTTDWIDSNVKIVDVTPDHFHIRNHSYQRTHVDWTASGIRAAPDDKK
jgi:hypothetical protein